MAIDWEELGDMNAGFCGPITNVFAGFPLKSLGTSRMHPKCDNIKDMFLLSYSWRLTRRSRML